MMVDNRNYKVRTAIQGKPGEYYAYTSEAYVVPCDRGSDGAKERAFELAKKKHPDRTLFLLSMHRTKIKELSQ